VPCQDFLSFYMQLKGVLKVSPWILCVHYVWELFSWPKRFRIIQCSSLVSKWLLKSWRSGILTSYSICHLCVFTISWCNKYSWRKDEYYID
jgi:hypothetical protein